MKFTMSKYNVSLQEWNQLKRRLQGMMYSLTPYALYYQVYLLSCEINRIPLPRRSRIIDYLYNSYGLDIRETNNISFGVKTLTWVPILAYLKFGEWVSDYLEDHTTNICESFHSHLKNKVLFGHTTYLRHFFPSLFSIWNEYIDHVLKLYVDTDKHIIFFKEKFIPTLKSKLIDVESAFQHELRQGIVTTLLDCRKKYFANSTHVHDPNTFEQINAHWNDFASRIYSQFDISEFRPSSDTDSVTVEIDNDLDDLDDGDISMFMTPPLPEPITTFVPNIQPTPPGFNIQPYNINIAPSPVIDLTQPLSMEMATSTTLCLGSALDRPAKLFIMQQLAQQISDDFTTYSIRKTTHSTKRKPSQLARAPKKPRMTGQPLTRLSLSYNVRYSDTVCFPN